jgi:hypothetical protein
LGVDAVDALTTHGVVLVKVTTPALRVQPPLTPYTTGRPAEDVATGEYVEPMLGDEGTVDVNVTVGVATVNICTDNGDVAAPKLESAAIVAVT